MRIRNSIPSPFFTVKIQGLPVNLPQSNSMSPNFHNFLFFIEKSLLPAILVFGKKGDGGKSRFDVKDMFDRREVLVAG